MNLLHQKGGWTGQSRVLQGGLALPKLPAKSALPVGQRFSRPDSSNNEVFHRFVTNRAQPNLLSLASNRRTLYVYPVGTGTKRATKKPIGGPGLWIDHEVLAKHMQSRPSRILLVDQTLVSPDSRFLRLADLAFGEDETEPKQQMSGSGRKSR